MSGADPESPTPRTPPFLFAALHEINERCLALLVNEARARRRPPVALVPSIRDLLLETDAEARRRAAQRGVLLADLRFQDELYWQAMTQQPSRHRRQAAPWRGYFPRRSAAPLARALLMLAWQSLHADRQAALVLLGITPGVAKVIEHLPLAEIDLIASLQYRHVQPRWSDQPAIWRELLQAAQANHPVALSRFDVHGLQLITGSLLFRADGPPARRGGAGRTSGSTLK